MGGPKVTGTGRTGEDRRPLLEHIDSDSSPPTTPTSSSPNTALPTEPAASLTPVSWTAKVKGLFQGKWPPRLAAQEPAASPRHTSSVQHHAPGPLPDIELPVPRSGRAPADAQSTGSGESGDSVLLAMAGKMETSAQFKREIVASKMALVVPKVIHVTPVATAGGAAEGLKAASLAVALPVGVLGLICNVFTLGVLRRQKAALKAQKIELQAKQEAVLAEKLDAVKSGSTASNIAARAEILQAQIDQAHDGQKVVSERQNTERISTIGSLAFIGSGILAFLGIVTAGTALGVVASAISTWANIKSTRAARKRYKGYAADIAQLNDALAPSVVDAGDPKAPARIMVPAGEGRSTPASPELAEFIQQRRTALGRKAKNAYWNAVCSGIMAGGTALATVGNVTMLTGVGTLFGAGMVVLGYAIAGVAALAQCGRLAYQRRQAAKRAAAETEPAEIKNERIIEGLARQIQAEREDPAYAGRYGPTTNALMTMFGLSESDVAHLQAAPVDFLRVRTVVY